MACIIWELPNGQRYLVAEGASHSPPFGASNTGLIDWSCKGATSQDELEAMLKEAGIPWGKAVKFAAQYFTEKQCSACKAREFILDRAKQNGWPATIKAIWETL